MPTTDLTSSHQYGEQSWYLFLKFDNILLGPPNNDPTNQVKIVPLGTKSTSPCPAACTPEALKEQFLVLLLRFLSNRQRLYGRCVKGSRENIRKASSHQRVTRRERQSGHQTVQKFGPSPDRLSTSIRWQPWILCFGCWPTILEPPGREVSSKLGPFLTHQGSQRTCNILLWDFIPRGLMSRREGGVSFKKFGTRISFLASRFIKQGEQEKSENQDFEVGNKTSVYTSRKSGHLFQAKIQALKTKPYSLRQSCSCLVRPDPKDD